MSQHRQETENKTWDVSPVVEPVGDDIDPDEAQEAIKSLLSAVVGMVPVVGGVLGAGTGILLNKLWPSGNNAFWEAMEKRVREIARQEIGEFYRRMMEKHLDGIRTVLVNYHTEAVKVVNGEGNPETARTHYWIAINKIEGEVKDFTDEQYKYEVLPLYAQVANMHLALLRDGIANGSKIGLQESDFDTLKKKLVDYFGHEQLHAWVMGKHYKFVSDTFDDGCKRTMDHWKDNFDYQRIMYLAAYDYLLIWKESTDPGKKVTSIPRRAELYLGPFGENRSEGLESFAKWTNWPNVMPPRDHHLNTVQIWYNSYGLYGLWYKYDNGATKSEGQEKLDSDVAPTANVNPVWIEKVTVRARTDDYFQIVAGLNFKDNLKNRCFDEDLAKNASETNQKVHEFGIHGWRMSRVHLLSFYRGNYVTGMVFGFRPNQDAWTPKQVQITPAHGSVHRLLNVSTGEFLGLDRYSSTEPAKARTGPGTVGQEWSFSRTADGTWRVTSNLTGRPLGITAEGALRDADGEATLWALAPGEDGTWSLADARSPQELLTATTGNRVAVTGSDGDADDARWVVLPVLHPGHLAHRPTLYVAPYSAADGTAVVDMSVSNPATADQLSDWNLSFLLPAQTGTDLELDGDRARLQSCEAEDAGVRVAISGTGGPLAPGGLTTFTLRVRGNVDADTLRPAEVTLNRSTIVAA